MPTPDVALLTPYPTGGQRHAGPSGVASYSANLAHGLADLGMSVEVIAPREPGSPSEPADAQDGPVRVRRTFDRGPRAMPEAARAAVVTGAPIVHLQHELFLYGGPAAIPGLVPALSHLRRRSRPVVTLHQVVDPRSVDREFTEVHRVRVPPLLARPALNGLQRSVATLASACIVHEPPFAESVPGAVVIPHGVEERQRPDRHDARVALGLDDRLTVLCFGFLAPYKGIEVVLEAGRLVGDDRCVVVVAGGPHPRLEAAGDPYADALEREWRGPGARFTGWVPETDLGRWFAAADVSVFGYPSPFSSSGALALAFAHGSPALLSPAMARCAGAPEALIAPADAPSLAGRLRQLLDPEVRREVAEATKPLAEARRWPAVAAAHLALYEDLSA